MIKVGIVGGSGNVAFNLIRMLLNHKKVEIKIVTSTSCLGKKISEIFPEIDIDLKFSELSIDDLNKMDIVFLAVPHGTSKEIASKLKCKVIDFAADHRLTSAYGLPEIFKKEIKDAKLIANPGCYATACILAVYPIKNMIKQVVFDCISGYSGAGKDANPEDYKENIIAYKIANHFHIKEMSKVLGQEVSFTPHVVNTFSGIMCTAHIFLKEKINVKSIKEEYNNFYKGTFVEVIDSIPCTKDVINTPFCHIGGFEADKNDQLVVISVIDNLLKGAASQAIENMNIMFGFDHKKGLQ